MTQLFTNNAYGTLNGAITNVATSIVLGSGQGARFPSPSGGDYFLVTLVGVNGNGAENAWEIVKCTARSTDTLTVVRAQESTTGVAWSSGARIELRMTAASIPPSSIGKETAWIPAGAMASRTTNGAASGGVETTTNKVMIKTLDFDASTVEYAQFGVKMPKSWNEGTVTAIFEWSHAATATNFGVAWALQGVAFSDAEALDAAFGTAITVTDTGGSTNYGYSTDETSAITIAGTPAAQDYVMFQVSRQVANGGDTMAIDARLHGIQLFYTTDAATDA